MPSTVYKPPGLPVFPPHGDPQGDSVLTRLLQREPWRAEVDWPQGFGGGLAHRLDNSTSGAMWVADDPDELTRMRSLFAGKQLLKTYRFLAAKDVPWSTNLCDRALAADRRHRSRVVVKRGRATPHRGRGGEAFTAFTRLRVSLWEARMRTGYRHQIRVHAGFLGIPILGDGHYGGGPTPEGAPAGISFFLHHMGLEGPDGWRTDPVLTPDWAS